MARISLAAVILCQIFTTPILGGRAEEDSPFLDIAASLLQSIGDSGGKSNANGLAAIGSLVGTLMQGDNARNLGSLFGQNGAGDAGDMLSGE